MALLPSALRKERRMTRAPWVAHNAPERPFDRCTWLCDCPTCLVALKREVTVRPRGVLCLKTRYDRIYVTAEYLCEVLSAGGDIEELCAVPNDVVREVFVTDDNALWPPARWRSAALDQRDERAGRKPYPRATAPRDVAAFYGTLGVQ
jgi:hypothetical protein